MRSNLDDAEGGWRNYMEHTWRVMCGEGVLVGERDFFFFGGGIVGLKCVMYKITISSKTLE